MSKGVGILALCCLSQLTLAQASTEIAQLSLKELLNLKVSVAETSGEEKITSTPAVVSRYNMSDMEGVGIRDFKGVLEFIPGIELKRAISGQYAVSIRGVFDAFNQKVLFLLDGTPYYMSSHSIIPLLGIPTEGISHIEVIRGPGAVIYGTNASAGVINVVTKKSGKSKVNVSTNDSDFSNVGGFYSYDLGENKSLYFSAQHTTKDQFKSDFSSGGGAATQPGGDVALANTIKSFSGGLKLENTNISFSMFEVENFGVGLEAGVENIADWTESSKFFHIDHNFNFENSKLNTYFDYNHYTLNLKVKNSTLFTPSDPSTIDIGFEDDRNQRVRVGARYERTFKGGQTFLFGTEFEVRSNNDYFAHDTSGNQLAKLSSSSDIKETSVFTQGDFNLNDFRLLIGARYIDHETAGHDISPRASLVYTVDEQSSIKLLYSQGFSSPNALQKHADIATIAGNPDLKPEKIETLDLAYSTNFENSLFVASIFHLKLKDGILRTANPSGETALIYLNQTEFERYGLELDYQRVFSNWKLFTNYTYLHKANEVWEDDSKNAMSPRFITSIGFSYKFFDNHLIGTNLNYKSERTIEGGGEELPSNYLVDMNYEYKHKNYKFFTTIYNLFNQLVRDPGVGSSATSQLTFESVDTMRIELGLKAEF